MRLWEYQNRIRHVNKPLHAKYELRSCQERRVMTILRMLYGILIFDILAFWNFDMVVPLTVPCSWHLSRSWRLPCWGIHDVHGAARRSWCAARRKERERRVRERQKRPGRSALIFVDREQQFSVNIEGKK